MNTKPNAEVLVAIKQRLDSSVLDAESLGRILLMLEWLVSSGATDPETVAPLLAARKVGEIS